jgi:xylulokinase
MSAVLACDLGGTSFRAALVDEAGTVRAETSVPGPFAEQHGGRSDIEPTAWWQALLSTSARLAQDAPDVFAATEGVAICGVTRTQVFLDGDGRSLRPAITWNDTRASGTAAGLVSRAPRTHPEVALINAFHPLSRLAWLREAEEETFGRLARVLEPKDFLNYRLCGRAAGDPVSMARLLAAAAPAADGSGDLFDAAGVSPAVLPPLLEPWQALGRVEAGLPPPLDRIAGAQVFCAANDTWTAVLGLGAMRPGMAYNISGTTEVLGILGTEPCRAEGLLWVDWRGLHQIGGPSQTGADTVAWLMAVLGREADGITAGLDALLAQPRHPQPLLFLPYLQGERVPYWDAALRGAFLGLERRHGAGDLAWAVLEGVAFLNRVVLERAEAATGSPVRAIRFGGGAAANRAWRQVKADVTGRPVEVVSSAESGIAGAAILAWTGLGRFASLDAAQDALVHVAARHEPDTARRAFYDELFPIFRRGETALAPISRDLAALASPGPTRSAPTGVAAA